MNTSVETMTTPLVSVHMITYNHAPYIAQAIEGVLMQDTDFPFELVIGEDCSTDGTREIVLDYALRYSNIIRVVTSDSNVGMVKNNARTRNVCRGKYIAWCEGDDYWNNKKKLQKQIGYLETHPDCGLVFSDYDYLKSAAGLNIVQYRQYSGYVIQSPNINDIIAGKAGVLTCTVVSRKEIVDRLIAEDAYLHDNEELKMGDTQLWAEIASISKLHCLEESLAVHRVLEESATQSNDRIKKLRFWISNTEMCMYVCQKYGLPDYILNWHERNWCNKTLRLAFFEQRFDLAEAARKRFPNLSPKNWIWYLGARYKMLRPFVLNLEKLLRLNSVVRVNS
jgi:glycosyltransferase involved in cell wall biosynthesis